MATGLRPASSNLEMIFPTTPLCSASGFRMLSVRSMAMMARACTRTRPQKQKPKRTAETRRARRKDFLLAPRLRAGSEVARHQTQNQKPPRPPRRRGALLLLWLEPDRQRRDQELDVVVGEVDPPAKEEVAPADDARLVLRVHEGRVGEVVGADGEEEVIEEAVVRVDFHPRPVFERVGELVGVSRNLESIVEQVELDAEATGVLEDPESAGEGAVPLGQVGAELELALGGDLLERGREERAAGRPGAIDVVHRPHLLGDAARGVHQLDALPLV